MLDLGRTKNKTKMFGKKICRERSLYLWIGTLIRNYWVVIGKKSSFSYPKNNEKMQVNFILLVSFFALTKTKLRSRYGKFCPHIIVNTHKNQVWKKKTPKLIDPHQIRRRSRRRKNRWVCFGLYFDSSKFFYFGFREGKKSEPNWIELLPR